MHRLTVRRTTRTALGIVVAAAATVVAAGCGDDDDKSSAKPKAFAITATAQGKSKAITFPKTVEAGVVSMTLENTDKVPRSAQILRIEGVHNTDNVLALVESDNPKTPEYIQDGGGIAAVKPGETGTVTQNLAPGKYYVWDDQGGDGMGGGTKNWELGAKGEFTVTGEASDDELPSVPATITATDKGEKDYGFEFEGLKAGKNRVRFENTGEQLHHALLFPLTQGSTAADFEKFLKSGQGRPPVDFENGSGTAVIDGDIAQNVELDLKAGNYVAVCFISDRDGGKKSHEEKGMIEGLAVK